MNDVDYSKIFSRYEKDPFRQKGTEELLIKTIRKNYSKKKNYRIIDIGCGTGSWLNVNFRNLTDFKNIEFFGPDNSKEMLSIAKASSLPLTGNSFDFVIMEYTYHQFKEKVKSLKDIYRILKKSGTLLIRNIDPWKMLNWSLYYSFPTAIEIDKKKFLRVEKLEKILNNSGFKNIKIDFNTILGNEYKTVEKWVEIMNNKTHSQFHIIKDEEYDKGMAQIKDLLKNNKDELRKILDNNISTVVKIRAVK